MKLVRSRLQRRRGACRSRVGRLLGDDLPSSFHYDVGVDLVGWSVGSVRVGVMQEEERGPVAFDARQQLREHGVDFGRILLPALGKMVGVQLEALVEPEGVAQHAQADDGGGGIALAGQDFCERQILLVEGL